MISRKSILYNLILLACTSAVLVPLLVMAVWVFTERWAWPDLAPQVLSLRALREAFHSSRQLFRVMLSSVFISSAVGLFSMIIGLMTTRAMQFSDHRAKNLISFFATLPLLVPVTVFAMGIQTGFIRMGLNNKVSGVILAHLICSLPYAVHLIADGAQALGLGLEDQARVLGASSWQAFRMVTLPLLAPSLLSAFAMAYIVSFSQYFLTLLIGGGQVKTFAIIMVPYLQGGERNIASIYSVIFLAVTLPVLLFASWLSKRLTGNSGAAYYS